MAGTRAKVGAMGLAAASFLWLYSPVFQQLVHDWLNDDNYSHGFLVVPFSLYFAWERRHAHAALQARPAISGLLVAMAGLSILVVGRLGADLFLTRVSLLPVLAGGIAFVWGWATVRILALPLGFLVLMIPLPAIIFNQIAFPLQLVASKVGEGVLSSLRIPVLREGNLIILARTTLEVADACSGIRSLISLLTVGILYGYFLDARTWLRVLIALSTLPIAIIANGLRVAGTGLAAHYVGDAAARGFLHVFSGWLVFLLAFVLLFVVTHGLLRLAPAYAVASSERATPS